MQTRLISLFGFAALACFGLAGCKNGDDRPRNTVGETRVFDDEERASSEKSRAYFQESVPAPQPIVDSAAARPVRSESTSGVAVVAAPQTVQASPTIHRTPEIAVRAAAPAPARRHNTVGEREVFD